MKITTDVRMSIETVDLRTTPLRALSTSTRNHLATYLDAENILRTSEGLWRDWRGILGLSNLATSLVPILSSRGNPMMELINILEKEPHSITFADYRKMLEDIDRWDVADDTLQFFVDDAEHYERRQQEESNRWRDELVDAWSDQVNRNCLTTHDVILAANNLPPQHYDAFILFADEDVDFAMELDAKVKEFGFKSCVKQRDFLAGGSFEHETIRQLLTERCNRLVVILSPDFMRSALNEYITNLAQSLAITQKTRKITPCLYKPCELPDIFKHVTCLDYQKSKQFYNFWNQLNISLQSLPGERKAKQCPQITITTIAAPEDGNSLATQEQRQTSQNQQSAQLELSRATELLKRSSNRKKWPTLSKIRSTTSKFGRLTSRGIFRYLHASEPGIDHFADASIWKNDSRHH